jgi:hypothetical protein
VFFNLLSNEIKGYFILLYEQIAFISLYRRLIEVETPGGRENNECFRGTDSSMCCKVSFLLFIRFENRTKKSSPGLPDI